MNQMLFLRVYELRKKFHYLIKNVPQNKNVIQRDLSACVEERFYGFDFVRKFSENERKTLFKPIDIVYKPVAKLNQIINCYSSKSMRNVYRAISDLKKEKKQQPQNSATPATIFLFKKDIWKDT